MLMHATVHVGYTDTVRESVVKVDSRKKNPLPHPRLEPRQYILYLVFQLDTLTTQLPKTLVIQTAETRK